MNLIGFVLLHRKVTTVAQDDAETETFTRSLTHKGIILNALRHVIRIVIDGLTIVAGDRLQHAVTHSLTIDVELMQADTSHIGCCATYLFVFQLELLAQVACSHACMEATFLTRQQLFQTYPIATPLTFVEQSDTETRLAAPVSLADSGPHLHLPCASGIAS